jgi:hypothetical protein
VIVLQSLNKVRMEIYNFIDKLQHVGDKIFYLHSVVLTSINNNRHVSLYIVTDAMDNHLHDYVSCYLARLG